MYALRSIARSSKISPGARPGALRAIPALSRPPIRSFWDQKQSELPKQTPGTSSRQSSSAKEGESESSNARQDQEPPSEFSRLDYVEAAAGPLYFSPYFFGLLAVGVGLVSYGLFGFYEMMTLWPVEVRHDLREGLRAKHKGDWGIATQYLTRAWNEARLVPRGTFGNDALLKISGIGIALAGVLEESGKKEEAYQTYQDVLWYLRTAYMGPKASTEVDPGLETLNALNGQERMRAVALAHKLGELAESLKKSKEEEEKWLVWSVEAILRNILDSVPGITGALRTDNGKTGIKILVDQLGLPSWCVGHNIAAPFEALGSFYSRHGNPTYALPLYLQAVSILIPPSPATSTVEDKCRGAELMGNIAELIIRNRGKDEQASEAIMQAESWAKKGLEVVTSARKMSVTKCDVCEEAYAVLLYNLAMVRELSGDESRARQLLNESLEHSKTIGLDEGIKHASGALDILSANVSEPVVKPHMVEPEIIAAAALE